LYAIGALPLLLVPYFRRNIPESQRFTEQQAEGSAEAGAYSIRPLLNMLRESPGRSLGVGISGFVPAIGLVGAFQFTGYHTQTVHGWTPGEYAAMVFFGGALGIAGNIIAGRLSDRFGRRTVGMLLLGSFPFWVALFYNASGFALTIGWIGFLFVSQGGRVILRAFATELFPTDQRASAAGFWQILEALGGATGLFLIYFGSSQAGDFAVYTTGLSFCVLVGGLVLFFFPETTQRELETISR
ncbi:MAG: MFS family permease, partial [Myxococcota bacterium]